MAALATPSRRLYIAMLVQGAVPMLANHLFSDVETFDVLCSSSFPSTFPSSTQLSLWTKAVLPVSGICNPQGLHRSRIPLVPPLELKRASP